MKFLLIFLFTINVCFSQEIQLDDIAINCTGYNCKKYADKVSTIKNVLFSEDSLRRNLKFLLNNQVLKNISYTVFNENDKNILLIEYSVKPTVTSVRTKVKGDVDYSFVEEMVDVREGDVFSLDKIKATVNTIKSSLESEGIVNSKVNYEYENTNEQIKVEFIIDSGKYLIIDQVNLKSKNKALRKFVNNKLRFLVNNKYQISSFKEDLNNIILDLKATGYFNIDIIYKKHMLNQDKVILELELINDDLYSIDVIGNQYFSKKFLKSFIKTIVTRYKEKLDLDKIKSKLTELYSEKGFYNSSFGINISNYKNKFSEKITHIKVDVTESDRTKIKSISFRGNYFFNTEYLLHHFSDNANEMVKSNYFHEHYVNEYIKVLKEEYLINGFVLVGINKPRVTFSKDRKSVDIVYILKEGPRAYVDNISIFGIEKELLSILKNKMKNKIESPFNPLVMQDDLGIILDVIKENGYFNAYLDESKKIISYKDNYSRVNINLKVVKDIKKRVKNIVIIGNTKTKHKFVNHVTKIKKGDLITPSYISMMQKKLLTTGAFKSVRVLPENINSSDVDLIINIEEKGTGNYEIVPGIRSDIGPKLKFGVNWLNIDGVNRTVNMSIQANQRIDLTSIDPERQDENKSLLEGTFKFDWSEPFIGWSQLNYAGSLSLSRLRYFSFDADIQRIVNGIDRTYNDNLSFSFKLKNEKINQFNGTGPEDEGEFIVGSLLPGLVADYRDNRARPMSGSYHELTVEYATPFFGSSDDISFATTISKNRVYIPIGKSYTLALSGTLGVQTNLISGGNIPSIKVFRLRGLETVRGFSENEINILSNGNDINDEIVDDKAYMANFKIEPRYLFSDNLMLGVFYDAGRVFYEEVDFGELRKSVGLSIKYLTPVGSINFDYGHKLLRKEDASGTLESPGRFHISIGFF